MVKCTQCAIRASYGLEGERPSRCAKHALPDMVNVKDKKCEHPGCLKQPAFNVEGEKNGRFCKEHSLPNMANVKDKKCEHPGCLKIPNFNIEGEKNGRFCKEHALPNMVDVISKKCEHSGCVTRPNYNVEGEKNARFCKEHALSNMVNVISKTCEHPGCSKQPAFNVEGETKRRFCFDHKLDKMINVISPRCKTEFCDVQVSNNSYEGYCLRCFVHLFPDKPVSRNFKTKESAVVQFVKTHFPQFDWIIDKRVQDGCSARRPDLFLDFGYFVLMIENDENQHYDYGGCSCENKRVMQLSQDVGHRPLIIIRFNPDDYIVHGKKITSCWGTDKRGMACIKKSKAKEWTDRLQVLHDQIEYWTHPENRSDKMVEVIHLFYDQE